MHVYILPRPSGQGFKPVARIGIARVRAFRNCRVGAPYRIPNGKHLLELPYLFFQDFRIRGFTALPRVVLLPVFRCLPLPLFSRVVVPYRITNGEHLLELHLLGSLPFRESYRFRCSGAYLFLSLVGKAFRIEYRTMGPSSSYTFYAQILLAFHY
jgi:hypothetical protein